MNKALGVLALSLSPLLAEAGMPKDERPDVLKDKTTTIHINEILIHGKDSVRQVIIQDNDGHGRINVHGWRSLNNGERVRYNHQRKCYELFFYDRDDRTERMVESQFYMQTAQGQYKGITTDPEILNKDIFPERRRKDFKRKYYVRKK